MDPYFPVFQRLAQLVEHRPPEFGQFIEEQHPVVGQGQLARARQAATAEQPRCGAAVVGAPKGPGFQQALAAVQQPGHRVDGRELKGLGGVQGWQQAGQSLGQHRFAAAGRAAEQEVMASCRSDLEGAAAMGLALDGGEIADLRASWAWPARLGAKRLQVLMAGVRMLQVPEHLVQIAGTPHLQSVHQGGLPGIGLGHHQGPGAVLAGGDGDGQHPPDRSQLPIEGQLPRAPYRLAARFGQLA